MTTDPTTILAAAGVSVPEVEEYREATSDYNRDADRRVLNYGVSGAFHVMDSADAAILALAREVAIRERAIDFLLCSHRAVDLHYIVPGANVGDTAEVKRILLARYREEASCT